MRTASQPPFAAFLPADLAGAAEEVVAEWQRDDKVARLWSGDSTLWTGRDEGSWLGWLRIPEEQRTGADRFAGLASEVREAGFAHVLLLGMGGSSLAPEVLRATFGRVAGAPELLVLDSTDPQQVRAFEERIDVTRTLFVVSSKSGTTLEPALLKDHFLEVATDRLGPVEAGRRFVAITDPGSALEEEALARGFRRVFHGVKAIGGRFSALSDFGLLPAAWMGLDVPRLLDRAVEMASACGSGTRAQENPGVALGALLGAGARLGRDRVTIVATGRISRLGAWLEQLVAESTGKDGKAILPIDAEPLAAPQAYGPDRLFVHLSVRGESDPATQARLLALEHAGEPIARIVLRDLYDLGAEFFRWEVATAVACATLGVHPFDQPDVEASKVATRRLAAAVERTGRLPAQVPRLVDGDLALYADEANAAVLEGSGRSAAAWLTAHVARAGAGDYLALLPFLAMTPEHETVFQALRARLRDRTRLATFLGFGPRYLHSTGQAFKGGPNRGVFLQVTADDARDLPVPGRRTTFGAVKAAQALGDFEVLSERGRRALRLHIGGDLSKGLARLAASLV